MVAKTSFDENDLGVKTKSVHLSQKKWRDKNWKETLRLHGNDTEKLIEKISFFDKWENILQKDKLFKLFIPEIYIDGWASIHLACFGMYKYANMSLRSELENSLRLVFFYTHPTEFSWWTNGNETYRKIRQSPNVWGNGYDYFQELETIKKLQKLCKANKRSLFVGKDSVNKIYSKLSKFIHSGASQFQTKPDRTAPKYDKGKFNQWKDSFTIVQENINTLLITQFYKEFKTLTKSEKDEMLKKVIGKYYAPKLKKFLKSYD